MKLVLAAAIVGLFGTCAADASPNTSTELTAFGGYSHTDPGAGTFDGPAYGVSARVGLPFGIYLAGGYDRNDTDDGHSDLIYDEGRAGAGFQGMVTPRVRLGAEIDYARLRVSDGSRSESDDGIAGNLNIATDLAHNCDFHLQAGYVSYNLAGGNLRGPELLTGVAFTYFDNVRFLVDYHGEWLHQGGSNFQLSSVRAGIRLDL